LQLAAALVLFPRLARTAGAADPSTTTNLLSAPLALTGDWGASPRQAAAVVITRMREVSLAGVRLLSDQQPDAIWVEAHSSGSPAIWLHAEPRKTAWIIVDIGGRDWCKLAYQFGHELGHVLANSWQSTAKPQPPTQWLEEAMVEAFSLRGQGLLAASWETNPPFVGDAPFAKAIRQYWADIIEATGSLANQSPGPNSPPGFARTGAYWRTAAALPRPKAPRSWRSWPSWSVAPPPSRILAPSTAGRREALCRSSNIWLSGKRAAPRSKRPAGCQPG
jgi:hypothetical protein